MIKLKSFKIRQLFFVLAIVSTFLMTSCEKDENLTKTDNLANNGISQKNGRLVFENHETFKKHSDWIYDKIEGEEVKVFNESLGFESLNFIYDKAFELTDYEARLSYFDKYYNAFSIVEYDSSLIYEMASPIKGSYYSNKDGIYQIGDSLFRFSGDFMYSILYAGENSVRYLASKNFTESDVDVKVIRIVTRSGLKYGQYSYRTAYRSSKYRLVARLKSISVNGERSIEAVSSTQRKRWGVWIGEDLSGSVGVKWDGNAYMKAVANGSSWKYVNYSGTASNGGQKAYYIVFQYLPSSYTLNASASSIKVTHTGASKSIVNNNIFTGSGF